MANDPTITVVGNLTDNPELRFTPHGVAMLKFRVASTPRSYDKASGAWRDGDPLFLPCTAWRDLAENISESLTRGARVVVTGRLRQSHWETEAGEKRSMIQMDVDEIGPSLRFATATAVARLRERHPDMPATAIAKRLGVTDRTVRRHLNNHPTPTTEPAGQPVAA